MTTRSIDFEVTIPRWRLLLARCAVYVAVVVAMLGAKQTAIDIADAALRRLVLVPSSWRIRECRTQPTARR